MLKFINKKYTFHDQNGFLLSYIIIGAPVGYVITQIILMLSNWDKYIFKIENLIFTFTFHLLIISPLIFNFFKNNKKYKNLIKKIDNQNKSIKIKFLYDYDKFTINESYILEKEGEYFYIKNKDKKLFFMAYGNELKDFINKFEIDDIKYKRLQKLNRLKKIW